MNIFSAFNINASGMSAQRYRMDIISENVANAQSTRTEDGTPYRRKVVAFAEKGGNGSFVHALNSAIGYHGAGCSGSGVKITGVYKDYETEMKMVYDPSHPDANEDGYVTMPNVTNMIDASRAFEANATAFNASKSMVQQGLQLGQS